MNPIEYDGCSFLVASGELIMPDTRIVAEGLGAYDGDAFIIESENGEVFDLTPYLEKLIARPLTGTWEKMYPRWDYYVVIEK